MKEQERLIWIDQLRGISMLAILLFHTEVYYGGQEVINYHFYVPNALSIFYFLSGYLFVNNKPFSLRYKSLSILRHLVIPYFVFTLLLAVPKAYVCHIPVSNIITHIVLGNGSWFVSSLIVAEVLFGLVLAARKTWLLHALPIAALAGAWLLTGTDVSLHHNYWNFHNALVGLPLFYAGYMFRRHEPLLPTNMPISVLTVLLAALLAIKYAERSTDTSLLMEPVNVSNYPLFLVDMLMSILLAVGIAQRLPTLTPVAWTGRHSLYFYFFCGAAPTAVAKLLLAAHIAYDGHYYRMLVAWLSVWLLCAAITYLIIRIRKYT